MGNSSDDEEMFVIDLSEPKPADFICEPTTISIPTSSTITSSFGQANKTNSKSNNVFMGFLTTTSTTTFTTTLTATSNAPSKATSTTTTNFNIKSNPKFFKSNSIYEPTLKLLCIIQIITIDLGDVATLSSVSDHKNEFTVEIPLNTKFTHLTNVVLNKLGYGNYYMNISKSFLLFKNCNPISTENVPKSSTDTVGDILGGLVPFVSFKIEIYLENVNKYTDIKDKLLQFFLLNSCNTLLKTDCPLSKPFLNKLVTTTLSLDEEPNEETRRKFYIWWYQQTIFLKTFLFEMSPQLSYTENLDRRWNAVQYMPPEAIYEWDSQREETMETEMPESMKSRARTTFDSHLELPKLWKWFDEDNHPSREKMEEYVQELNGLESRKNGRPLDVNNVLYWFKNKRAAKSRLNSHLKTSGEDARKSNFMGFQVSDTKDKSGHNNAGVKNSSCCSNMSCLFPGIDTNQQSNKFAKNTTNQIVNYSCATEPKKEIKTSSDNSSTISNCCNYSVPRHEKKNVHHNDLSCCYPNSYPVGHQHVFGTQNYANSFSSLTTDHFMSTIGPNFATTTSSHQTYSTSFTSDLFPPSNSIDMSDEKKKRNRTFIDPFTEVPKLDSWYQQCSHPTYSELIKFTGELNDMPYRTRYPKLESKNVQFWFKNRRAKTKRTSCIECERLEMN